jgi:hypothetical protein
MKSHFIGFADSDKFLAAIDRERPVNLNVGRKFGRPDRRFGISVDSTVITLSQVRGNEVLYFEHVTHRYQTTGGQVLDLDEKKHVRLAKQVHKAAEQYLQDRGVSWRDALLSMPRNYMTLDGVATFLRYDKETESYHYRKAEGEGA